MSLASSHAMPVRSNASAKPCIHDLTRSTLSRVGDAPFLRSRTNEDLPIAFVPRAVALVRTRAAIRNASTSCRNRGPTGAMSMKRSIRSAVSSCGEAPRFRSVTKPGSPSARSPSSLPFILARSRWAETTRRNSVSSIVIAAIPDHGSKGRATRCGGRGRAIGRHAAACADRPAGCLRLQILFELVRPRPGRPADRLNADVGARPGSRPVRRVREFARCLDGSDRGTASPLSGSLRLGGGSISPRRRPLSEVRQGVDGSIGELVVDRPCPFRPAALEGPLAHPQQAGRLPGSEEFGQDGVVQGRGFGDGAPILHRGWSEVCVKTRNDEARNHPMNELDRLPVCIGR